MMTRPLVLNLFDQPGTEALSGLAYTAWVYYRRVQLAAESQEAIFQFLDKQVSEHGPLTIVAEGYLYNDGQPHEAPSDTEQDQTTWSDDENTFGLLYKHCQDSAVNRIKRKHSEKVTLIGAESPSFQQVASDFFYSHQGGKEVTPNQIFEDREKYVMETVLPNLSTQQATFVVFGAAHTFPDLERLAIENNSVK